MKPAHRSSDVIAYFITSHGFGHAARAIAVMQALHNLLPGLRFELFTTTPEWFFQESLAGLFDYHALQTDVGLVQTSSLHEDIPATLKRLDAFIPFADDQLGDIAQHLHRLDCRLVLCDISALGIACARKAGIPSVLIENFTWDWIYSGYLPWLEGEGDRRRLRSFSEYLADWRSAADFHIQTEPVCVRTQSDLTTPPVSRMPRLAPAAVREALGIPSQAQIVLLTMGGVPWSYGFINRLSAFPQIYFLIPGGTDVERQVGNVISFPYRSRLYHPDLIQASDVVVGKVGYSTMAEVHQAGRPYGYILRPRFPESAIMAAFIEAHMPAVCISEESFRDGQWLGQLETLLNLKPADTRPENGAEQIAAFVIDLLHS